MKWIVRYIFLPFCPFVFSFNFPLLIAFHRTFFSLTCKYQNNEHENDFANSLGLDFEMVVYAGEFSIDEGMKDDDLPSDLLRLVAQDEKQILPHQEVTEAINLGTEEERKEVKIETTLSNATRKKLMNLL